LNFRPIRLIVTAIRGVIPVCCTQIPCPTEQGNKFTGTAILIVANSELLRWEQRIDSA